MLSNMFKAQIEHPNGQEKKPVQSIQLKRGKALEERLPYNSNIMDNYLKTQKKRFNRVPNRD
jgi:hypothetical protein